MKSILDIINESSQKYHLTDETIKANVHTLHRIIADKSFGDVKAGDKGGFIESEDNLSQTGDAWIYDDAKVYHLAKVYDNAKIRDHAIIADAAKVFGNAEVSDYAMVYGHSKVFDNAKVCDKASVYGNAVVFNDIVVSGNDVVRNAKFLQ